MAQKHIASDTEYPMTRMGTIQQPSRRYRRLRHPSFTAAIWTANNPLLQRGEFGAEIDTGKLKVGDGVTYWNDLGYVAASQIDFADITGSPDDNVALKGALDAKQDVLTAGSNITITGTTISATDTTYSVMTGASAGDAGTSGLVPAPAAGDQGKFLQGDGTWATPPATAWGSITGTLSDQTDLANALAGKANTAITLSGYGITDGANTDLSNLTTTGKVTSAHLSMPSGSYDDLTLGTSGATYTAPADGWLFLNKTQGTANTRIEMYNQSSTQRTLCIGSSATGQWLYGSMQAKKGDVIEVVYSATGTTNAFRFIYAQGAQ